MSIDFTASESELESWFSVPRMRRYLGTHTESLYLWNTRITKSFLEDIQHIEVALRNTIDESLVLEYGSDWLRKSPLLESNSHLYKSVNKAQKRAGGTKANHHQIIAELPFDVWRFLLLHRYQAHVWKHVRRHLPHYDVSRRPLAPFEKQVDAIYKLRNRCAHHESLVLHDRKAEYKQILAYQESIFTVARWIDPQLARWITKHSRVSQLLEQRP